MGQVHGERSTPDMARHASYDSVVGNQRPT
jgi:hypothetical protein